MCAERTPERLPEERDDGIVVTQLDKRKLTITLPGDPEAVSIHLHDAACESFRLASGTADGDGTLVLVLTRGEGR